MDIVIPEDVLRDALKRVIDLLIEKYDELGMRASGNWADSLEYRIEDKRAVIMGEDYTEYLTRGRNPGKNPPVQVIYEWMLEKRSFRGEKSLGRAFAISKSIGKRGTSWYQKGGSDLVDILEDPAVVRTFFDTIGDYLRVNITEQLRRDFETLAI